MTHYIVSCCRLCIVTEIKILKFMSKSWSAVQQFKFWWKSVPSMWCNDTNGYVADTLTWLWHDRSLMHTVKIVVDCWQWALSRAVIYTSVWDQESHWDGLRLRTRDPSVSQEDWRKWLCSNLDSCETWEHKLSPVTSKLSANRTKMTRMKQACLRLHQSWCRRASTATVKNKKLSYRRETAHQLRIHAQLTRCFSAVAV